MKAQESLLWIGAGLVIISFLLNPYRGGIGSLLFPTLPYTQQQKERQQQWFAEKSYTRQFANGLQWIGLSLILISFLHTK